MLMFLHCVHAKHTARPVVRARAQEDRYALRCENSCTTFRLSGASSAARNCAGDTSRPLHTCSSIHAWPLGSPMLIMLAWQQTNVCNQLCMHMTAPAKCVAARSMHDQRGSASSPLIHSRLSSVILRSPTFATASRL